MSFNIPSTEIKKTEAMEIEWNLYSLLVAGECEWIMWCTCCMAYAHFWMIGLSYTWIWYN